MEDIKYVFSQNLIHLRKQMKITQVEFAEKINYSDKAVSKWERGESIPDVAVLKGIADFFGVTIDFLVTEHKADEPIKEKTGYEKAVKTKNHILISSIVVFAVLICALTVFVSLQSAFPQNVSYNVISCFVLPLPVYFLLLLIFSSLWSNKAGLKILFVSLLIWSLIGVCYSIVWMATSKHFFLIFVVGVPAQLITLMSFGIINLKSIRIKSDKKHSNKENLGE